MSASQASVELRRLVPHRYPMLLLDRLESLVPGRNGRALKAVSANESHEWSGGLPSTLVVDALGQLAIAVLQAERADSTPRPFYLATIEAMEFPCRALAGDLLRLEAEVERAFQGKSRVRVRAHVEAGGPVAEGVMVLAEARDHGLGGDGGRS